MRDLKLEKTDNTKESRSVLSMHENSPRKNVPFLSEVKRFTDKIQSGPANSLGPGYYESTIPIVENKKYSNPRLLSESHRFQSYGSYIDIKKAKNLPGPGAYDTLSSKKIGDQRSFNN
jgi:hypothetical protein